MAERWEFEEATAWFSGSRGADESCDDVCAAALCGEEREDECPEPPTCLSDALEALWADTACAIHTDARESAGAAALTTCGLCGPDDYSNKYCLPGIIDSSPGVAYFGASTSGSGAASLCAVQYTDDRTEPLCPCLLPAPPVAPGGKAPAEGDHAVKWLLLCLLGALVVAGGAVAAAQLLCRIRKEGVQKPLLADQEVVLLDTARE